MLRLQRLHSFLPALFSATSLLLLTPGAHANDHSGGDKAAGPAPMMFVVNVGKTGHGGTVLQTQIVLEGANATATQSIEAFKPALQHQIIQIISAETPERLRTADGKSALGEKILEASNKILGTTRKTGVKEVFFTHFILQQP